MALYVPASTRRRRAIALAGMALLIGLVVGFGAGRRSAPTAQEQIESIQIDARRVAASLRVLALHDEADAVSTQGAGGAEIEVALERSRRDLAEVLADASWIDDEERTRLLEGIDALRAEQDRGAGSFATAAEDLAAQIEGAFGSSTA